MFEITTRMKEIFDKAVADAKVQAPTSKLAMINEVFDGMPHNIDEKDGAIIFIEGIGETTMKGVKQVEEAVEVEITVAFSSKLFYGETEDDVVLVKKAVQEVMGKVTCDGTIMPHSIKGILYKMNCLTSEDNTCKIANDVYTGRVRYGMMAENKGTYHWKATISIVVTRKVFRS